MVKKILCLVLVLGLGIWAVGSLNGCGQAATTSGGGASGGGTTGTDTITIKGVATSGLTTTGLRARASAPLANADVSLVTFTAGSTTPAVVTTGKTDSNGSYSLSIDTTKYSSDELKNCAAIITSGSVTVGATIPSVDTAKGAINYAQIADETEYKKTKILQKTVEKGIAANKIDFTQDIDQKFDTSLANASNDDLGKLADAVKSGADAELNLAASLGITSSQSDLLKAKRDLLFKVYIQPVMKSAFENGVKPSKKIMDALFSLIEEEINTYANTVGVTPTQSTDFKNMKDQAVQANIPETSTALQQVKNESGRRSTGNKIIGLFIAQFDAADTCAMATPTGGMSFKDKNTATYESFVNAKARILASLEAFLTNTTLTDEGRIGEYLYRNFIDIYILPPPNAMEGITKTASIKIRVENPPQGGELPTGQQMESIMQQYVNSRIFVYFFNAFGTQKSTIFSKIGQVIQPIFQKRFSDSTVAYYMGDDFWKTNPTPDQMKTRLDAFKAAFDAAWESAGINSVVSQAYPTNTANIIAAMKILMAPPDAF